MAATYESTRQVPIKKWKRGTCLRKGGMGEIFIGQNAYNNEIFLVKSVPERPHNSKELAELHNEARILRKLSKANCPSIFRMLGSSISSSVVHFGGVSTVDLFLEFAMPQGSVADKLQQEGKLTEVMARASTVQLLHSLACMHRLGIVHYDIKAQNIIICDKGARLVGFGVAKETRKEKKSVCLLQPEEACCRQPVPEQELGPPSEADDDIRALGCTVCEMVTGKRPELDGQESTVKNIIQTLGEDSLLKTMPDCLSFIRCCLKESDRGPALEWTAQRLLHHAWVTKYRASSLPHLPYGSSQTGEEPSSSRDTPRFSPAATPRIFLFSTGCKDLLCCPSKFAFSVQPSARSGPLPKREISPIATPRLVLFCTACRDLLSCRSLAAGSAVDAGSPLLHLNYNTSTKPRPNLKRHATEPSKRGLPTG